MIFFLFQDIHITILRFLKNSCSIRLEEEQCLTYKFIFKLIIFIDLSKSYALNLHSGKWYLLNDIFFKTADRIQNIFTRTANHLYRINLHISIYQTRASKMHFGSSTGGEEIYFHSRLDNKAFSMERALLIGWLLAYL